VIPGIAKEQKNGVGGLKGPKSSHRASGKRAGLAYKYVRLRAQVKPWSSKYKAVVPEDEQPD
jgi:hypothetical protein